MLLRLYYSVFVFLFISAAAGIQAQSVANFVAVPPCRVADTRDNSLSHLGTPSLKAGVSRDFPILESSCGIPATAVAYSLNITVVPQGPLGYITVWPAGQKQPFVSTLNSFGGAVIANAAIVGSGTAGALTLFATDNTDVILDINGYFTAAESTTDQLNQAVTQINKQITQTNQQVAQQGSQLTQQIGQAVQQSNQLTQQVNQLSQQVTPITQQLSQITQTAAQVSQQASQVSQLVSQVNQQSTLLTTNNGVLRLGTPGVQTKTYIAGISGVGVDIGDMVLVDQNGQLGTIQSSKRYKENIQDLGTASERIYQLRPVQFQYKRATPDGQKPLQYGLIAEEVAQIFPEMVVYNKEGDVETVQYQKLPALLLNEIQKQHLLLEEQKAEIGSLSLSLQTTSNQILTDQKLINQLVDRLSAVEAKLSAAH